MPRFFPYPRWEGDNVARLVEVTEKYLPEGPQYYPADAVTDQPLEIVISELIREKVLLLTRDEVPHSIAVFVENMERDSVGKMQIEACIYVERGSQKGIITARAAQCSKKSALWRAAISSI